MSAQSTASDDLLRRVRTEFRDMPGLRLTERQAGRLWGLDQASCAALLTALVDSHFLIRTRDGSFMRIDSGLTLETPSQRRGFSSAA
jgi:hypothetical protein